MLVQHHLRVFDDTVDIAELGRNFSSFGEHHRFPPVVPLGVSGERGARAEQHRPCCHRDSSG
jgi:hypothetical protein